MRTTNPIAALLGSSPFKPMQAHMRIVKECVAEVPGLFDALIAGNQEEMTAAKDRIFAKEQEADDLKNDLRAHLPKSLFMPVDRRDLLEILELQDTIANTAQDIAGLMMERDMSVPDTMAGADPEVVARAAAAMGFPLVVKLRRSRMGVGVIRCRSQDHLDAVLDSLWRLGDEFVVQRWVECDGVSMRLFTAMPIT